MARVVSAHQGILAIGPDIEHVKDAVTQQRRLDAKLVKIKAQLKTNLLFFWQEPLFLPDLTHGLVAPTEAVHVPGPGTPVVNAEAAVEAVMAEADWVARAHEVKLPGHGGVAAGVAGHHHPVLLCVRETEARDQSGHAH